MCSGGIHSSEVEGSAAECADEKDYSGKREFWKQQEEEGLRLLQQREAALAEKRKQVTARLQSQKALLLEAEGGSDTLQARKLQQEIAKVEQELAKLVASECEVQATLQSFFSFGDGAKKATDQSAAEAALTASADISGLHSADGAEVQATGVAADSKAQVELTTRLSIWVLAGIAGLAIIGLGFLTRRR